MAPDLELRRCGRAMGTTTLVVVARPDAHVLDAVEAGIADLERRWSRFLENSEISRLNRADGAPVLVSRDTFDVIRAAIDAAIATDGLFDPTVHDSMTALGYDRDFHEIGPTDAVPRPAPGVGGIDLDESLAAVTLPAGVRLDLGGIGKGAAADLVSASAMARGARGIAVSIGGDVRVRGESPTGHGWRFVHDDHALDLPALRDGGVCTSTTRRRRWATSQGEAHHIIDPASGTPTATGIESVSVVAATAQQAEVLTKAAMVAGSRAEEFLEPFGVHAVIRPPVAV